ncbi:hypothetical protein [Pontibacter mangrovi]|uniref:Uncharacterized protein n=1 Tax=Pontibacter mangrovi TaxID=2589816 RepID=A0A501VZZ7_9BACT|nr:hypothetical protein [Pontibacter mangrovi]TPE43293.1 hypothetical protein FJM65_14375 [Pontibacter mangrovi]
MEELIVFEVDSSTTDFVIVDADFIHHRGLYQKSCFCVDAQYNKAIRINSGKVLGRKINQNTWLLQANVSMLDFKDTATVNQEKILTIN